MNQLLQSLGQRLRHWSIQPPFAEVLQSDESECGLACLSMMFSALGKPLRIEDLRLDYCSTQGGTTIGSLCSFDQQRLPVIIFARDDHFSVLWNIENERYFIAEPSDGSLVLDAEQFSRYASEICIGMRAIPKVATGQKTAITKADNSFALLPLTREILVYVLISMLRELASTHINHGITDLQMSRFANLNEFHLALVENILNALMLAISAILIIHGNLTTGSYAAVSVMAGTALQPVRSIAQITETLQSSTQSFRTVNDLFQAQALQAAPAAEPKSNQSIIEIQNVSFQYSL